MFKVKRVYEPANPDDGARVLVDRLWPRGVSKTQAKLSLWLRDAAPSDALRKWFGHDPRKWEAFRRRYQTELKSKSEIVVTLKGLEQKHQRVTLLFAAADPQHNNAVVLARMLNTHRWKSGDTISISARSVMCPRNSV